MTLQTIRPTTNNKRPLTKTHSKPNSRMARGPYRERNEGVKPPSSVWVGLSGDVGANEVKRVQDGMQMT
jgi:hypothetical protein